MLVEESLFDIASPYKEVLESINGLQYHLINIIKENPIIKVPLHLFNCKLFLPRQYDKVFSHLS
jgi:hypothetical protein